MSIQVTTCYVSSACFARMRTIGQLPSQPTAQTFSDFLQVEGIANEVEPNPDGTCTLWVLEEEMVAKAGDLLKAFLADPNDAKFQGHARSAKARKEQERVESEQAAQRVRRREEVIASSSTSYGVGPLSGLLLLACCVVFLLTDQGRNRDAVSHYLISYRDFETGMPFTEIRAGEVWRLFTPMLLHFGFIHLLVNSLWILSLGSLLEIRRGTGFLIAFVLVNSAIPNLAQYLIYHNPYFGGMSGVTFALAGYAWQRGKHDPGSGIGLDPQNVTMLVIFFVACWLDEFDLLGGFSLLGKGQHVANVVHTVGLVIGGLWGIWDARRFR